MAEEETLWVINVGGTTNRGEEDLELSIFQFENANGERFVPAFSTRERAVEYAQNLRNNVNVHMDLLESSPNLEGARAVTEGDYNGLRMTVPSIVNLAAKSGVSAVVIDPDSGPDRRIIRVPQ
jgi:hypothetical protein